MRKTISFMLTIAMVFTLLGSFTAARAASLLSDGSFEVSEGVSTGKTWTFKSGSYPWYQYGGGAITDEAAADGAKSFVFSAGVAGQRVKLESGRKYSLTAKVNPSALTTVKTGFHDGSENYPNDNPVLREDITLSRANEWNDVKMEFDCEKTQEYVICFYNDKKVRMYLDDVRLTEVKEPQTPEGETERITVLDKNVRDGQLIYNLTVKSGTQGILTASLYTDGETPTETKTLTSSSELMTFAFSLPAGAQSGRVEFTLTDAADPDRSLSLPAHDTWTAVQSASKVELNFNTYPLYVGNASTTNFANWDGYGSSIDLEASVVSDTYSAEDLVWTVSDSEIVSMTVNGKSVSVKGRRTGYSAVTASLPDGASASCYIPVIDNYNRFQTRRIVLNADSLTLGEGAEAQLKAILYPKNVLENNPVSVDETLIWESSDDDVATVDESGSIKALSEGTAKIAVRSSDVGREAYCTVTVKAGAQAAEIAPVQTEVIDMKVGETTQLNASSEGYVYWRSDNSYIADVDADGVVRAYSNSNVQVVSEDGMDVSEKPGTVKIYATAADGGKLAEYEICVSDAPASVHGVKINKETLSIPKDSEASLTAVVTPAKILDKNITWTSDNEAVVTVTNDTADTIYGAAQTTLKAVGEGKAKVTASSGGKSDSCIVTVTNGVVKVSDIDLEAEKTIDVDEVYRFTPEVTADAADRKLIWLDTDENVATIDRDGNVMGYSAGTVTVYAIARDSLSADEVSALEDLKYDVRTIGTQNETLNAVLAHAIYKTCTLTVQAPEGSVYLRNLHIPSETVTDSSLSLLWNRASLVFAPDIEKYIVYRDGEVIAETTEMAYTVNGLSADTEYGFKVEAYKKDGVAPVMTREITARTKPAPAAVLNVLDYGAVGNGLVTDTYALQSAIDACPENGVVWLPGDGRVYYSGALFLKSDMTLKVDGVILGSIDPKDYPSMITRWEGWRKLPQSEEEWANSDNLTTASEGEFKQIIKHNHYQNSSLINAGTYDEGANSENGPYNVRNLTICGNGQINGNGFSLAINEGPNLPSTTDRVIKDQSYRGRTVLIQNSQNVYMKDIMISYSPSWTIHPIYCDSMSIGGIKDISLGNGNVGSGYSVPSSVGHIRNGDGIDPDSCTHMNIYNSYFRCGDDVVTLKSGRNKEGNDLDKPNAYIRVTDCFAHSSIGGFGSGSEVAAGSHDVLFQSLYLESTDCYGIWYKTHPARGGLTENMQARDCYTGGGRSVVRVNYDFSLESGKPAQTINLADNPSKRYQTKARYLTYENVGGEGWTGNGRYCYDMYGLRNNKIHTDKGMPSNISIDHVVIRNANISGNLTNELIKCSGVEIWDSIPDINWKQTGSSGVVIHSADAPQPTPTAEPDPTEEPDTTPRIVIDSKSADDEAAYYVLHLSTGESCVLIAASYNEDGSLYALSSAKANGGSEDVNVAVPYAGADVKLMAWNSMSGMKPLADAISDTAVAQDNDNYLLAEDFSNVSDSAWGFSGSNSAKVSAAVSDVQASQAADIEPETVTLLLGATNGQYVKRTLGKNISSKKKLSVSFDWQPNIVAHASKPVPRNSFLSLTDEDGNNIISLSAHILDGIKYSLDKNSTDITYKDHDNKTTTQKGFTNLVDIDSYSTKWYRTELELDFEAGTVKGTIADRESGEVKANIDAQTVAKNLSGLYAYNGYSAAPMSLDNIYIKGGDGVDKGSLEAAVNIYSAIDENNYQEYGMDSLAAALENAKAVLAEEEPSQAKVGAAKRSVLKAAAQLRAKEEKQGERTIIDEAPDWIFVKEKEAADGASAGTLPMRDLSLSEWSGISLPHTWNAQDGSDGGPGGVPDYDRTRAWYRKTMYVDAAHKGRELYLEFGGAGTMCELYINGKHVPYANEDVYGLGNSTEYRHRGGFSKFRFDITDYVNYGSSNEVAVLVDNSKVPYLAPLNGDFNCQGGLYRDVKLVIADAVHVDMSDYGSDGIYLTPVKLTGAEDDTNTDFSLEARARIVNDSDEEKTVTIAASLNEPSEFTVPENDYIKEHLRFEPQAMYTEGGAVVKEFESETVTIPAHGSYEYKKETEVIAPHLWNGLEDPYRYEVKLSITENERVHDEVSAFTGFRYYRIPAPEINGSNVEGGGFYLNGKPYTLRGAGKHQDVGRGEDALGYAITMENMLSDAGLMYELGMNSVRLVHYQHSNEEIELYDKLGITVWSEIGVVDEILSPNDSNYGRFMSITKAQLTELIRQQYNHPSVIVWGLGNEIRREMTSSFSKASGDDANSPDLATDYHEQLNALAKELDPTRQTTYAAFCLFNRSKDWESDTAAMNLYPYWYTNGMDKWYQSKKSMDGIMTADLNVLANADSIKPLGISEYGGGGEEGYLRPYESDGTVKPGTSYPDEQFTTTYQAYLHEKIYNEIVNKLPWAWCSYVWQLFDSASDKKQGGLPGTNDKGLIAFDHETKKDAFYFYKANWNDIEPFVHIVGTTTSDIIRAYSNYDALQLYVNDEPFGEPITDVNTDDGVVDGMGVFMWYGVPEGEIRIEGIMS